MTIDGRSREGGIQRKAPGTNHQANRTEFRAKRGPREREEERNGATLETGRDKERGMTEWLNRQRAMGSTKRWCQDETTTRNAVVISKKINISSPKEII